MTVANTLRDQSQLLNLLAHQLAGHLETHGTVPECERPNLFATIREIEDALLASANRLDPPVRALPPTSGDGVVIRPDVWRAQPVEGWPVPRRIGRVWDGTYSERSE